MSKVITIVKGVAGRKGGVQYIFMFEVVSTRVREVRVSVTW